MNRLLQVRILGQVQQNLVGLQRDIAMNAKTHGAMLAAGSPPAETVAEFVSDCIAAYEKRIKWVEDWLADEAQRDVIDNALEVAGFTEADVLELAADLRKVVNAMAAAKVTAEAIEAASIDMPPSLWPE